MQWTWQSFWTMGGYGLYVWSSLGMCALVALLEITTVRQRHARIMRRLRQEKLK